MPEIVVNQDKLLEYFQHSSAVLEKTAAITQEADRVKTAVAAAIPGCVESLIGTGIFSAAQGEKIARALSDPVKALDFLQKVADSYPAAGAPLGAPAAQPGPAAPSGRDDLDNKWLRSLNLA